MELEPVTFRDTGVMLYQLSYEASTSITEFTGSNPIEALHQTPSCLITLVLVAHAHDSKVSLLAG